MAKATAENLIWYTQNELQADPFRDSLERHIKNRSSSAGTRHEEVFTREFLCPVIRRFFYDHVRSELNLSDSEIRKGLGTEGFENCPGFGFTPGHRGPHLFAKLDIISARPPEAWFNASGKALPPFHACPEFAIRAPLPFSIVGETKFFRQGSPSKAVKELYDAARQAVFYLGAFPRSYDSAMIVIADASPDHAFHQGLDLLNPELWQRFGAKTGVHLVTVRIT